MICISFSSRGCFRDLIKVRHMITPVCIVCMVIFLLNFTSHILEYLLSVIRAGMSCVGERRGQSRFCLVKLLLNLCWALALTLWIRMLLDYSLFCWSQRASCQSTGMPADWRLGLGSSVQCWFPKPRLWAVCTYKCMPVHTCGWNPGVLPCRHDIEQHVCY